MSFWTGTSSAAPTARPLHRQSAHKKHETTVARTTMKADRPTTTPMMAPMMVTSPYTDVGSVSTLAEVGFLVAFPAVHRSACSTRVRTEAYVVMSAIVTCACSRTSYGRQALRSWLEWSVRQDVRDNRMLEWSGASRLLKYCMCLCAVHGENNGPPTNRFHLSL